MSGTLRDLRLGSRAAEAAAFDLRFAPVPAAGQYYNTTSPAASSTSNTHGIGTLRLLPWLVGRAATIDRIGAEITTAGDAGSKLRLGIYADNGKSFPGALLLDAGQIAGDSATVQELTTALALPPGLYWIGGALQSVTTTQPTVRVNAGWSPPCPIAVASGGLPSAGSAAAGYSQNGVTAALPSAFTGTLAPIGTGARVLVRAA